MLVGVVACLPFIVMGMSQKQAKATHKVFIQSDLNINTLIEHRLNLMDLISHMNYTLNVKE
jgi:hypothetical protein